MVHTILAPLNSQFMRPNLPARVFTCALTPPLRPSGQWMAWLGIRSANGIRWLLTLSSQPLTYPFSFHRPLGAFVLADHQNHEDFKSTPASAAHSSSIFSVQQNLQFPLPQVFNNQDELLSLARLSASEGYLSEEAIPFLGHSNQHMTFKKVRWALRFPLPPPSKDAVFLPLPLSDRALAVVRPSKALSGLPPL